MATQVQFRGGTTSEHSTFTGVAREVTVDTTKKTVVVHDGSTAGGIPLAKESAVTSAAAITGGSINGTTVGASTASTGAFTTLSASSTVSGAGFSTYLASPPAIGGTTASTGRFTTVTATGLTSGRVTYAGASGLLSDSANLAFDGNNLIVGSGSSSAIANKNIDVNGTGDAAFVLRVGGTTTSYLYSTAGQTILGTVGALPITFNPNGTERMRITSAGNVGIGTSSPLSALDVRSANATIGNYQTIQAFTTNTATIDFGGGISLGGNYSSTTSLAQFGTISGRKENATDGNYAGYLQFGTNSQATGVREVMRLDSSGNLGLGVTPAAWAGTGVKAFQFQNGSLAASNSFGTMLAWNTIYDGSYKYVSTATAGMYQVGGGHTWYIAPSGTAGNTISFTQAMTLDSSGNLLVGTTTQASSVSNTKNIVGGVVNSFRGSLSSLNSGTAYTMFTMTADFATYIVTCSGLVSSAAYSETAIVHLNNTSVTVTIIADGSVCTISNSGLNIQYTQSSGAVMADMAWSVIRIL